MPYIFLVIDASVNRINKRKRTEKKANEREKKKRTAPIDATRAAFVFLFSFLFLFPFSSPQISIEVQSIFNDQWHGSFIIWSLFSMFFYEWNFNRFLMSFLKHHHHHPHHIFFESNYFGEWRCDRAIPRLDVVS